MVRELRQRFFCKKKPYLFLHGNIYQAEYFLIKKNCQAELDARLPADKKQGITIN